MSSKEKKETTEKKEKKIEHIMFMIDYMLKHSSVNHKLSASELMTAVFNEEFPDDATDKLYDIALSGDGKYESRVFRFFRDFFKSAVDEEENIDEDDKKNGKVPKLLLDIKLYNSKSKGEGFDRKDKRYYAEGPLSEEQVAILRDAICVYPYAEKSKTQEIVNALNRMTTVYNQMDYNPELVGADKYPGTYYENLKEIYKAFSVVKYDDELEVTHFSVEEADKPRESHIKEISRNVSKISFEYYEYVFNEKKHKIELAPKILKSGSIVRTVNPLKLLWSNGYYYLVTYYKNKDGKFQYLNYRVDRMKNVKCKAEAADMLTDSKYMGQSGFKVSKYKGQNPVMYSSDEGRSDVVLRCKKYLLNNALDTFGFDIRISDAPPDELMITVYNASPQGVIMWALEYGESAEIVSPAVLREKMKNSAEKLLERYK